jgi:hypothetical protein
MAPRCFVTAPNGPNLTALINGLGNHGWETYVLSDVAELGASLSHSLLEAISSADVVVGLLEDPERSSNTLYELGIARGLQKPVMVVAAVDAQVPSDLISHLQVRAEPGNAEAIALGLEHLSRYKESSEPTAILGASSSKPLGEYSQVLIDQYSPRLPEAQQVRTLAKAIEASGALASVSGPSDPGFDIGVWSDDLDAIGANPLLVVVRRELDERSVRQCMLALHQTPGARAGLIVSIGEPPADPIVGLNWPVLTISLSTLLVAMGEHSFAEIVRDLRNRSVHGLAPR